MDRRRAETDGHVSAIGWHHGSQVWRSMRSHELHCHLQV